MNARSVVALAVLAAGCAPAGRQTAPTGRPLPMPTHRASAVGRAPGADPAPGVGSARVGGRSGLS